MKAERLPSGSWRVRVTYTENGVRHSRSFTAKTARAAERKAMEYALNRENMTDESSLTVHDAIDAYLSVNEAVLSPSTMRVYRTLQRTAYESISKLQLSALTNSILQRWISQYSADHSPKTVRNVWGLLSSVINSCCPGMTFNINLPQRERQDIRIPQREEVNAILKEAEGTTMYLPLLLAAHCGLRRSEIAALTWDSIDMKNRIIHVREALVRGDDGWTRKGPKTSAGKRDMDMTDAIYNYLLEADRDLPLILVTPKSFTERFKTICKHLGLQDYHPHLLRHYYASCLCLLRVPETYAVKLMGHSSADMIRKVYGHTLDDPEKQIRKAVIEYLK